MIPGWPPTTVEINPVAATVPSTEPGQLNSGYLRFWLPIIGPTATLAYRHLLDLTGNGRHTGSIDMADLANDLGVGHKGGKNAPAPNAIKRLIVFRIAEPRELDGSKIDLLTELPFLDNQKLNRLRPDMARAERLFREHHLGETTTTPRPRPRPTRPLESPLRRAAGHDGPPSRSTGIGR